MFQRRARLGSERNWGAAPAPFYGNPSMDGCRFWAPLTEGAGTEVYDVVEGRTGRLFGQASWDIQEYANIQPYPLTVDPFPYLGVRNENSAIIGGVQWHDAATSHLLGFVPKTISFWLDPANFTGASFAICKASSSNYDFGLYLSSNSMRPAVFYGANNAYNTIFPELEARLNTAGTHNITLRWDPATNQIAWTVDELNPGFEGAGIVLFDTANRRLQFGGRWEGSSTSPTFNLEGTMSEVRMWDRVLSDNEILGTVEPSSRFDHYLTPLTSYPFASGVPAGVAILPGNLRITGQQVDPVTGQTVIVGEGMLGVKGALLNINAKSFVGVQPGALAVEGQALTANAREVLEVANGALEMTGQLLVINAKDQVVPDTGALGVKGVDLLVRADEIVPIGEGQVAVEGQTVTVLIIDQQTVRIGIGQLGVQGQSIPSILSPLFRMTYRDIVRPIASKELFDIEFRQRDSH